MGSVRYHGTFFASTLALIKRRLEALGTRSCYYGTSENDYLYHQMPAKDLQAHAPPAHTNGEAQGGRLPASSEGLDHPCPPSPHAFWVSWELKGRISRQEVC